MILGRKPLPTGQHAIARAMRENKELKENEKKKGHVTKEKAVKKKGHVTKGKAVKMKGQVTKEKAVKKKGHMTKHVEQAVRRRVTSKSPPSAKVGPLFPNLISSNSQAQTIRILRSWAPTSLMSMVLCMNLK